MSKGMLKSRRVTRKKQRGGAPLYINLDQFDLETIQRILCNGKLIEDLPIQTEPIFVLKWGAPGSGKSSEKTNEVVRSFGYPLDSYFNFNTDKLFEAFLPYRMETTFAKAKQLRMRANYEQKDFVSVKKRMQFYIFTNPFREYCSKIVQEKVKNFLDSWESGVALSPAKAKQLGDLLTEMTNDEVTSFYKYYRRYSKNSKGLTLQEKTRQVLQHAFQRNVHILYESVGSGYTQEEEVRSMKDQYSGLPRLSRGFVRGHSMVEIYKNTKEQLLGKILYNESQEPIGIDPDSLTENSVPLHYRINVIYPILPKKEILARAKARAIRQFTEPATLTIPDSALQKQYLTMYNTYLDTIIQTLGGEIESYAPLRALIDTYVQQEAGRYSGSYTSYLQSLRTNLRTSTTEFEIPLFGSISQARIEETIEQSFQYSIDYFLKQYLIVGRIEKVLYISTLGPKITSTHIKIDH